MSTSFTPQDRTQMKVAIFSAQTYVHEEMQPLVDKFPASFFIEPNCSSKTAPLCKGAGAVCLFVNDDASEEVISVFKAEGVKLILMRCAGYDRVDLKAAEAAGIKVLRVPAYSPYAVAEHALGLAMCLNRKLHRVHARVREGNFALSGLVGMDMRAKTIGIVGTGGIGCIAASIFKGIGMKLIAYDVYKNDKITEMGGEYVELDDLWARADVISLHVPLLPSTKNLVCAESIEKMKPGVILINCSRGGLVKTTDLLDGLVAGKIGAAGLDVYEDEHNLFFQDFTSIDNATRMKNWDTKFAALTSLPNVIVSPHSAFLTKEALENICSTTISNLEEFVAGKPLTNEVKPQYK